MAHHLEREVSIHTNPHEVLTMIHKKHNANHGAVQVTFELPADIAEKSVAVVGDFNDWNTRKAPMKLNKKKGVWSKTISLEPDKAYEFRYFVDEDHWRNEETADRYTPNPFAGENCVLEV